MKRTFRKNLLFVLCTMPLLVAFQCDDEFKPDEEVENLGLVEIEDNKTVFSVGDYLVITTSINNQQMTTDGKTINLRDYMYSNELNLLFDMEISKIGSTGEEMPYFVTATEEIEGTILAQNQDQFFYITSPYNESTAAFASKIGIKLTEIGSYALKTSTIKDNLYVISFDATSSLGSILLTTNISNSNEEGIYRFSVE